LSWKFFLFSSFCFSCFVFVLVFCSITFTYNVVVADQKNVVSAWSKVDELSNQRLQLASQLSTLFSFHMSHSDSKLLISLQNTLTSLSQNKIDINMVSNGRLNNYELLQEQLDAVVNNLFTLANSYLQLKSTSTFQVIENQFLQTEVSFPLALKFYNEESNHYNSSLNLFFVKFIAHLSGFQTKPVFDLLTSTVSSAQAQL
jgi:LemA protein